MLTFKGPGSLVWSPGSLLRAGGTLGTLGTLQGPKREFADPPPPEGHFLDTFCKIFSKVRFDVDLL